MQFEDEIIPFEILKDNDLKEKKIIDMYISRYLFLGKLWGGSKINLIAMDIIIYLKLPTSRMGIRGDLHSTTKIFGISNAESCYLGALYPIAIIVLDELTNRVEFQL